VFVLTAAESERTVDQLSAPKMEPPGGYRTKRHRHYYRFEVYCVDRETGRVLWRRTAVERVPHEGRHGTNTYASCSPATDGKRLYVTFGSHGLFCYDLDGKLIWQRDLGDITGTDRIRWHHSRNTPYVPSPLLYKQRLYFTKVNRAVLSCLDARTGKPLMEGVRLPDLRELYASPLGAANRIYFVGRGRQRTVPAKQATALLYRARNAVTE